MRCSRRGWKVLDGSDGSGRFWNFWELLELVPRFPMPIGEPEPATVLETELNSYRHVYEEVSSVGVEQRATTSKRGGMDMMIDSHHVYGAETTAK